MCGIERWTVKTLQDRPRLLPVHRVTIHYLVTRPAPAYLPDTRLPFERHVFRVTASVILVRPEDDGDFHVVLSKGRRTMIAESPTSSCTAGATLLRRRQMARARQRVQLCNRAVVTGVAFFDFKHGQTGVAPNAIELHPVLAFRCLRA
jgi:glycine/D-amino acid oxidase-like deaminating enzyme